MGDGDELLVGVAFGDVVGDGDSFVIGLELVEVDPVVGFLGDDEDVLVAGLELLELDLERCC